MASYEQAKAKLFSHQRSTDVAIGSADDQVVMRHLARAPGRHVTFGADGADYRIEDGHLVSPHGVITPIGSLQRSLPHDLTNGLAASALVLEAGLAEREAVAAALSSFVGPPHRIEFVPAADGVAWFNDSKATTPHAASAAIDGFDSVVLIAGGQNKGLDLTPMAAMPGRIRTVVAIGEAGAQIAAVFAQAGITVTTATSMSDAVDVAGAAALPGDVVLLSPGCASFDWYPDGGYAERGDHFRTLVRERLGLAGSEDTCRPLT
jgi:UDP-N-acetylmuramoylalanine--D-glutamate ligase